MLNFLYPFFFHQLTNNTHQAEGQRIMDFKVFIISAFPIDFPEELYCLLQ
jgi:hypothetical protein